MLDLVAIFPDKIFQLLFSIAQMYYMQYLKPNMQYFEYQAEFSVCMSHYISKRSLLSPNHRRNEEGDQGGPWAPPPQ